MIGEGGQLPETTSQPEASLPAPRLAAPAPPGPGPTHPFLPLPPQVQAHYFPCPFSSQSPFKEQNHLLWLWPLAPETLGLWSI